MSTWEVDLAPAPFQIEGAPDVRILVVVERDTGLARAIAVVPEGDRDAIAETLRQASSEPPPPCQPQQPARVLFRRVPIQALVQALPGAALSHDAALPNVERVLEGLVREHGPPWCPGFLRDEAAWTRATQDLAALAPWRQLGEHTHFTFQGLAPLDDAVALLLGQAGEVFGLVLYPTRGDLERTEAAASGDLGALHQITAMRLEFMHTSEATEDEVAACRRIGASYPGDRVLQLSLLQGGRLKALPSALGRILLPALEGVVALCQAHLDDLAQGHPCDRTVPTSTGAALHVSATAAVRPPPPPQHALCDGVAVFYGRFHALEKPDGASDAFPLDDAPAIVVKHTKRNAVALAKRLDRVDRLVFHPEPHGVRVDAWAEGQGLGTLFTEPDPMAALGLLQRATSGHEGFAQLIVSAGGAKRRSVRSRDFQILRWVRLDVG